MDLQSTASNEQYLEALGERVRALRARRGMSRRILAGSSGVSERYLADLEQGKGNISIIRLRDIATALGLPMTALLSQRWADSSDFAYLMDYLSSAAESDLRRLRIDIAGRGAEPRPYVALVGLRGAGKTTVGQLLAQSIASPFIDLVDVIEREAGMDVSEIFSLGGQSLYRRFERRGLEQTLQTNERAVVEAGGSLVSEAATFEYLLSTCFTIWLKADPDDHMNRVIAQGDHRPMAGHRSAMDDLKRILNERESLYARADVTIETSGRTPEETVEEILALSALTESTTSSKVEAL